MKFIHLTTGEVTIVDDEDFDRVNQYKWYCLKTQDGHKYAHAIIHIKDRFMSRFIMNPPKDMKVDHINRNSLDNRKINLRICTNQQNIFNSDKRTTNTSGYKGVIWEKLRGCWRSQIMLNGKFIYLGRFKDKIAAAKAYNKGALKYHGEFAGLNIL